MPRLFLGPREINFVADINKELIKDVIGESIYLWPISEVKTDVHGIYEEAPNKVFENPIEINALVDWGTTEVRTGKFGTETIRTTEVYIQSRDMIDRNIQINEGDFFSYGNMFFEIVSRLDQDLVFGQIEYESGIKLIGKEARQGQFDEQALGRVSEGYDAPILPFYQQRGYRENPEGLTGDVRAIIKNKTLSTPITGIKQVSKKGDESGSGPAFDDEC